MGEAKMFRLRGDLLNATGDQAAAEENYHQALGVARRQCAKNPELRAASSLARLLRFANQLPSFSYLASEMS
jgi:hypothetical protein